MAQEKFDRQLRLMVLLAGNTDYTIEDLAHQTGMSRRTIYRYIDTFKDLGFEVKKDGPYYQLGPNSPFFLTISNAIHFSTDEAITINRVLNSVYDNTPQVRHLRKKLAAVYDFKILADHGIDTHIADNLHYLYRAAHEERMCVLHAYNSPHSGRTEDRIVEPYMFLSGNSEVRCFEVKTQQNKTFKVSRAKSVEVLDLKWVHKREHLPFFTDLFHFSGERRTRVRLLLGHLSASLLREESPFSEQQMIVQPDGRYLLDTQVCSYKGVGRFVLGLYDDIEIFRSPGFKHYIENQLSGMLEKFSPHKKKH